VLLSQKGRLYRDIESRILTDETANRDAILSGLAWLQNAATENDVAMVFLSGHGVNEGDAYYYLPVDFARDRLAQTAIPFSVVRTALQSIPGKVLFFVDSCHSGNALGLKSRSLDVNGVVNELSSAETGAVVFAASTGRQVAFEDPAWGNGAFTKAVVEGLGGKADLTGSGRVTVNMLDLYISERVKALTAGQQTPATSKPQMVPDFPVAMTH
jgi:uncharacterized caspase-like protein